MKKLSFIAAFLVVGFLSNAQKGENYIGLGFDLGIPTGDFGEAANVGFGGSLKFLLGVGQQGQVSFTTGYSAFQVKGLSGTGVKAHMSIIPILLGYRHNFNGVYLEPQLGVASYGAKFSGMGQSGSDSDIGFTFAAGFGYARDGLDIGLRYQYGKLNDGDSPFSLIGVRFGYNFLLGKGRR